MNVVSTKRKNTDVSWILKIKKWLRCLLL